MSLCFDPVQQNTKNEPLRLYVIGQADFLGCIHGHRGPGTKEDRHSHEADSPFLHFTVELEKQHSQGVIGVPL